MPRSHMTIEQHWHREFEITVDMDDHMMNPRESMDPLSIFVARDSRYDVGDSVDRIASFNMNTRWLGYGSSYTHERLAGKCGINVRKDLWFPLYLYDHGGASLSTTRQDPWDSRFVGFAVVPYQRLYDTYVGAAEEVVERPADTRSSMHALDLSDIFYVQPVKPKRRYVTQEMRDRATSVVRAEIDSYSSYLEGDGYIVSLWDDGGNEIDSIACTASQINTEVDYMRQMVDQIIAHDAETRAEALMERERAYEDDLNDQFTF